MGVEGLKDCRHRFLTCTTRWGQGVSFTGNVDCEGGGWGI